MMTYNYTGQPAKRVDGRAKVTGAAAYSAEFNTEDLTYGFVVSSEIARGSIANIVCSEALALKGVLQVFTHENTPQLAKWDLSYKDMDSPPGSPFRPLSSPEIMYSQQPIALVVAETYELARYAASLVRVSYFTKDSDTKLEDNLHRAYSTGKVKVAYQKPTSKGNFSKAYEQADVKLDATYYHGAQHHNPMEPHASTVHYGADGTLTVYDKTQGVLNSQHYVSMIFGLPKKKVRVLSPFVGGAFGSGLRPQYQLFLAVLAALELKRSVKVVLTRQQMFSFGHRPVTLQKLSIGASADGRLQAMRHAAYSETSRFENYIESIVNWGGILYRCDHIQQDYQLVDLDMYTPIDMRAPGAATGVIALECAMDELAHKLSIDPLELRLINYAEKDHTSNKPFSSKELRECYRQAAEKFGWSKRNPELRSMKNGHQLVGWGMATGVWDAMQLPSAAKAVLSVDGKLHVSSATSDIGTGTYTIMTQLAAETLGLPLEDVTFKLGDSSMPLALIEGGSATAASVGTAVKEACGKVAKKLLKLARRMDNSAFKRCGLEDVSFSEGYMRLKADPSQAIALKEIMRAYELNAIEKRSTALPNMLKQSRYAMNTHSAVFAEVQVDEQLGTVKVTRVVSAVAAGKILNPTTAKSQILGGIVWGISMALQEETVMDHQFGRFMNHNLAEYHVPVNADIHDIDIMFVEEHDEVVNPLGIKGVGEIGLVGVAAAIANAVFHATGKRVREFPIHLDNLL